MNAQIKLMLDQWAVVKADREEARKCLENTGPGESPFSREQVEIWTKREEQLQQTIRIAMPELELILAKPATIREAIAQYKAHQGTTGHRLFDALVGALIEAKVKFTFHDDGRVTIGSAAELPESLKLLTLQELELLRIKAEVARTPDRLAAAKALGIDQSTLYRKRKRYEI